MNLRSKFDIQSSPGHGTTVRIVRWRSQRMDQNLLQEPIVLAVVESSQVAESRRRARETALECGLTGEQAGCAALIATEAATNLIKHAGGGEIILRANTAPRSIDIVAIDRGPGMTNLAACLRDGYSTVGTGGKGLGAIVRQSSAFDAYSQLGRGAVVFARVAGAAPSPIPPGEFVVDGLSLRMRTEQVSGDAWAARTRRSGATVTIVDGLGHGAVANEAAMDRLRAFEGHGAETEPLTILDTMNRAPLKTRGAAVAIADIDAGRQTVKYIGIGNISALIVGPESSRRTVSVHGTAGRHLRRLQQFTHPWNSNSVLIMHSDGVTSHLNFDNYPGLAERHPLVVSAVLLRDWARGRDDATVVVARQSA